MKPKRTPPRNLDELLVLLPGLRKLRSLDAALLRTLLDRPAGACTWCGNEVAKGRSTWCSDQCVETFKRRCDSNHQRAHVLLDRRGICADCGRDTQKCERIFAASGIQPWGSRDRDEFVSQVRAVLGYSRGQWREVDHVVPVCLGGGLCGPEGLRLLCGVCHHRATAALAKQRSKPQLKGVKP